MQRAVCFKEASLDQKAKIITELGRIKTGYVQTTSELHWSLLRTGPRPPPKVGLGTVLLSGPNQTGPHSHQPKRTELAGVSKLEFDSTGPNGVGVKTP